ncbi:unnamed protein product [Blepharisma stoltei]|uniref:Uncharacterized protein n=1 Tax=Blepharisma stoltei TaxID=1481888 RepID=A0AAU9ITX0_9CILI|nr:unnamed protein product [Blepharisma stoltei]
MEIQRRRPSVDAEIFAELLKIHTVAIQNPAIEDAKEKQPDTEITVAPLITSNENKEPEKAPIIKKYCKICMNDEEDIIAFDCAHQFCNNCVNMLLLYYIESGNVSEEFATCPDCKRPISDDIFQILPEEAYSRYKYLFEKHKVNKIVASGVAILCPVTDCPGYAHIIPEQPISACTECMATICVLCKSGTHPMQTCEEYAAENKDTQMDSLLRSRYWKRCPTCGVAVERTEGCNFMVCYSTFCQGSHAFCYACGKYLVEDTYYMHFTNPSIDDNNCNTLLGDTDHDY